MMIKILKYQNFCFKNIWNSSSIILNEIHLKQNQNQPETLSKNALTNPPPPYFCWFLLNKYPRAFPSLSALPNLAN